MFSFLYVVMYIGISLFVSSFVIQLVMCFFLSLGSVSLVIPLCLGFFLSFSSLFMLCVLQFLRSCFLEFVWRVVSSLGFYLARSLFLSLSSIFRSFAIALFLSLGRRLCYFLIYVCMLVSRSFFLYVQFVHPFVLAVFLSLLFSCACISFVRYVLFMSLVMYLFTSSASSVFLSLFSLGGAFFIQLFICFVLPLISY